MGKKNKISFNQYYEDIYGGRWPGLKEALLGESVSFRLEEGLCKPYFLDPASAVAARELGVTEGETVLDMCAAPGGKTLLLALALNGTGRLVSNDRSSDRRRRLKDVISGHLPEDLRKNIIVTGHDAAKWGLFEKEVYDRVLLDAPCSSEEHVLKSPAHLARWSPARTRQLSIQAHAMLAAAVDAVKTGGTIIYSTCSLSPLENDEVIKKLLKKRGDVVRICPPDENAGEKTEYGTHILPDSGGGQGPIYFVKLIKMQPAS